MINFNKKILAVFIIIAIILTYFLTLKEETKMPQAKQIPHKLETHKDVRIDNYYWLNDKENPEVIEYLEAENSYTAKKLSSTENLQEELFLEMKARIKEEDSSLPTKKGDYYYYSRFEKGSQYPIYCRKYHNLEAEEEIFLDVNKLAKGHEYFNVGNIALNFDQSILAYSVDVKGRRIYNIFFKDLKTGKLLDDKILEVTGNAVFSQDNYLFYTDKDQTTLRSNRVYLHKIGQAQKDDQEIYFEEDETYHVGVSKSKTKDFIYITSSAKTSNEVRIIPSDKPLTPPQIFHKRESKLEYSPIHAKDKFYILTNYQAKNFRIMESDLEKTKKENWREVIAHRPEVLIEDVDVSKDYLVLSEVENGLDKINIFKRYSLKSFYLPKKEEVYTSYIGSNHDYESAILRYGYQSMTTPASVYDFDIENQTEELKKQQEVLGDFKKENYLTKRIFVKSHDDKEIPVSMVYHKNTKINSETPLLLYGYGSYGYSIPPSFSSTRLSLLNRGFIFAIANIRGGSEMGRSWYEDGKMLNKKNTFKDFISVSKYLIANNYTSKNNLYGYGGSAGGLLIGAVINMEPELFNGVISAVPFVDVLTTMLDDSIPLTTSEYDEWGNPNEKKYYDYIKSYCPYSNVEAKNYPNILVTTGLHDSQVQYFEPAKWVAKLREFKTDENLLLMKTQMEAGHSGATGRFSALKEVALDYAFLLHLEGK
ncbi:MAG: oligopeptidase B [Rickettsiales bacterium]|jgi:oligopeptidase B